MSGQAHGLQPDGHEHVHCHYCNADGVHVQTAIDGTVLYGPHARKGSTVKCMNSRGQAVPAEHREKGRQR